MADRLVALLPVIFHEVRSPFMLPDRSIRLKLFKNRFNVQNGCAIYRIKIFDNNGSALMLYKFNCAKFYFIRPVFFPLSKDTG